MTLILCILTLPELWADELKYQQARQALTAAANGPNSDQYQQALAQFLFYEMVYQKSALSLRQILQRYYDPKFSSTPALPQEWGPLIFLGNTHNDSGHIIINTEVINRFAHDGDVVLLESTDKEKWLDPTLIDETASIQARVNVAGWDDVELLKLNLSCIRRYLALLSTLQEKQLQMEKVKLVDGTACDQLLNEADSIIKEGARVQKIINKLVEQRNASLLSAVATQLKALGKGQHLFVIAGSAHLTPAILAPLTKRPAILIPLPTAAPEQESSLEYYRVQTLNYENFICNE